MESDMRGLILAMMLPGAAWADEKATICADLFASIQANATMLQVILRMDEELTASLTEAYGEEGAAIAENHVAVTRNLVAPYGEMMQDFMPRLTDFCAP